MPTSRATRVTSRGEAVELIDHRVDGRLQLENFALHVDGNALRQVAARNGRRHVGDVAHLGREVAGEQVDVVGQVFPGAGDTRHVRLAAETPFGADLARDARHLAREAVELVDHGVQRFLQLKDLAAHVDGDLARKVAGGDGGRHLGDVAHLVGKVAGHRVDRVRQVLPRAGDARHLRLAAELAFGADLARDARHLGGEGVELIDHRVDGLFELQDFARDVDRHLLRQVALGDGGRHLGDVAHLAREVRGHRVDRVGQVLPRTGDAAHHGLAAELAFGADLARDARHLAGEGVELIDHRVDGLLQLEHLAAHVDGDLLRQVAVGDGRRHLGDVANLRRQVRRHRVDRVGQVLPRTGDAAHLGLTAEAAFRADLAGDARHLAGEGVELIDHRVDGLFQLQDLARDVDGDLLRQVAAGDGGRHLGDVAHLSGQVRRHRVDVVGQVLPRTGDARHLRLAAELAFGADLAGNARHLAGEAVELIDHRVDRVLQLEDFALHVDGDLARKVAARDGGRHLGDVAHLGGEVGGEQVDVVGQVLPRAGDARHHGLAAETPFGADLARDARHLGGERAELIDHRVDGFLQLQNLAAHVDGDLLRQVAHGDRDRHLGDVAHLGGQVRRHRVDALGEVLPHAGHFRHLRLAAELAVGADLARDARHLRGEHRELLDHRVDDGRRAEELALQRAPVHVETHGLQQVALGDRADRAGDLGRRPQEVVDQLVDRGLHAAPGAGG